MMFLYILLIGCVSSFEMPSTWLNPADLHHSRNVEDLHGSVKPEPETLLTHSEEIVTLNSTLKKNESCFCPKQNLSPSSSYLKRVINLLLIKASVKNFRIAEEDVRIVPLTLYFTSKNLEIFHAYASSEPIESFSWADFDEAFSSLFETPPLSINEGEKMQSNTSQRNYSQFIFMIIVGGLLSIGLWIFLTSGSLYKSLMAIGFTTYAVTLLWNLRRAYQNEEKKIRRLHLHSTRKHSNSFIYKIFSAVFGSGDSDSMVSEMEDPLINMDFGKIVVETFCSILEVFPILGEKLGIMIDNMYGSQDWLTRYIVRPLSFGFFPITIFVLIAVTIVFSKGFFIKFPFITVGVGNNEAPKVNQFAENHEMSDEKKQLPFNTPSKRRIDAIQERPNIYNFNEGSSSSIVRVTEFISLNSLPKFKHIPLNQHNVRKGPWKGSVLRSGFVKKKKDD